MTNREKIMVVLQVQSPLCDICLTRKAGIVNQATTNQIDRELANEGVTLRRNGVCPGCKRVKLVNSLLDNLSQSISPKPIIVHNAPANSLEKSDVQQSWFWEGNIQAKIEDFLVSKGYQIVSVANTALKSPGVDIIATSQENQRLLVTVKGFPKEGNTSRTTQARHWFGESLFDLILYRQEFPNACFAIGLPAGFQTYQHLKERITWFKASVPFTFFWVDKTGQVNAE